MAAILFVMISPQLISCSNAFYLKKKKKVVSVTYYPGASGGKQGAIAQGITSVQRCNLRQKGKK